MNGLAKSSVEIICQPYVRSTSYVFPALLYGLGLQYFGHQKTMLARNFCNKENELNENIFLLQSAS